MLPCLPGATCLILEASDRLLRGIHFDRLKGEFNFFEAESNRYAGLVEFSGNALFEAKGRIW
jgi:hypothetical protein